MVIENKIKLGNNKYFVGVEVYYENKKLHKKSNFNNYFDSGDLTYLINSIENNYDEENYIYDKDVLIMNDLIYIYDYIPFLSYIKVENEDNNLIINLNELEKYIKNNNINLLNKYLNSVTPLFFNA